MKIFFTKLLFVSVLVLMGCQKKSHENEAHEQASEAIDNSGNEALYNEVMKVHDEVMPKMNDIYNLKQELSKKLADSIKLTDEKKNEIENTISKLDSANESMMVWMRQFNPIPDSLGEEKAREYLESEMEKVKKVREDIVAAIDKGKKY